MLDPQRSSKSSTESLSTLYPASFNDNILHNHRTISQNQVVDNGTCGRHKNGLPRTVYFLVIGAHNYVTLHGNGELRLQME